MGILKKMGGMKVFLILCLSVLSYSRPQPEFKIIIHFHPEPYQPPPARGGPGGDGRIDSPPPPPVEGMDAYQPGPVRSEIARGGFPYNPAVNRSPWSERRSRRMGGAPLGRESGFDYSDDEEETVDEAVTPKAEDIDEDIEVGDDKDVEDESEPAEPEPEPADQSGTTTTEAGQDYNDYWKPKPYHQPTYGGGYGHHYG